MTSAQRRLEGEEEQLRQVTEALIFAANEPVTADKIARIYMRVSGQEAPTAELIGEVIKHLNKLYDSSGCSLRIYRWGGGYRMATITEVAPYLKEMFSEDRSRKLSRSLMETLSVIAYKQPVSKPEVDFIRGVDSDYAIRKLLEGGLIDLAGRGESVGRPLLYQTSSRFLEEFGLGSIDELPKLKDLEDLLLDGAFSHDQAALLGIKPKSSLEHSEVKIVNNGAEGD